MKTFFHRSKLIVVVAFLVAGLSFSMVGETGAWLVHTSGTDSTTMTKFTNNTLTLSGTWPAITVKNNSNIPMYVRVVMAVNYINDTSNNWNGNAQWRLYWAQAPSTSATTQPDGLSASADYSFTVNSSWKRQDISETVGDKTVKYMVFYYTPVLAAGGTTTKIFDAFTGSDKTKTITVHSKSLSFKMTAELLVEGIQAERSAHFSGTTSTAVYKAWGVTPASVGGALSSYVLWQAVFFL